MQNLAGVLMKTVLDGVPGKADRPVIRLRHGSRRPATGRSLLLLARSPGDATTSTASNDTTPPASLPHQQEPSGLGTADLLGAMQTVTRYQSLECPRRRAAGHLERDP